ncbi:MAG: flagellar hook-length control protein FliK [Pyrinomonadaceae bacterium]|nr:flagellar hook-length control protein FliK [Pyrinomonadaceae bacterium]
MLKVESNKGSNVPDNRAKQTDSSGNASRFADVENGEGSDLANSDFARVLGGLSEKKSNGEAKKSLQTDDKTDESEDDSKVKSSKTNDGKSVANKQVNEKQNGDKNEETDREDVAGAANVRLTTAENPVEIEQSLPPARAILHIADLERIVSTLRTQNVEGNRQVVITLKNSVMNGLQIKLTTDENRKITAEFIAGNEKVKAQLDARSGELADILRRRGVQLASLQTSIGSGSTTANSEDNREKQQSQIVAASASSTKLKAANIGASEVDALLTEDSASESSIYRA